MLTFFANTGNKNTTEISNIQYFENDFELPNGYDDLIHRSLPIKNSN